MEYKLVIDFSYETDLDSEYGSESDYSSEIYDCVSEFASDFASHFDDVNMDCWDHEIDDDNRQIIFYIDCDSVGRIITRYKTFKQGTYTFTVTGNCVFSGNYYEPPEYDEIDVYVTFDWDLNEIDEWFEDED